MNVRPKAIYLFKLLIIIGLIPFLSSCFELREELDFNKNGSGKYAVILDLSDSREVIKRQFSGSGNFRNPFVGMDSAFRKGAESLNGMKGISVAESISDTVNFVFGMRFNFADVGALNRALNETDKSTEAGDFHQIYAYEKKTWKRKNFFHLRSMLDPAEIESSEFDKMKEIIRKGAYTQIFRIKDGKFRKFSNKAYELSENKNRLTLRVQNALLVLEGKIKLFNEMKFK